VTPGEGRAQRDAVQRKLAVECLPQWYCDHCGRRCYGDSLIYEHHLCLRCIGVVAQDPKWAHCQDCRLFLLERENGRLNRLVVGLRDRNAALVREIAALKGGKA
jgi:hypothetical protein